MNTHQLMSQSACLSSRSAQGRGEKVKMRKKAFLDMMKSIPLAALCNLHRPWIQHSLSVSCTVDFHLNPYSLLSLLSPCVSFFADVETLFTPGTLCISGSSCSRALSYTHTPLYLHLEVLHAGSELDRDLRYRYARTHT